MKKTLYLSILLFAFYVNCYAVSLAFGVQYVPIDSISQNHSLHYISLDLSEKKISLYIDNRVMAFEQTVFGLDTTRFVHSFPNQSLVYEIDSENFYSLRIKQLQSVGNDSIYISAVLQKFNVRRGNVGRSVKISDLAIAKSELSGILISQPTIREVRRTQRRMVGIIAAFTAIIVAIGLISGEL